ncbi:trichohyalin isoform X2 [Centropristis striata]|uniref:trichohyalin isoform X2 n=1 Tax=Centropristis striata TaxID=184440 RepID=UPI0027E08050|nr:trichohyalin isoform X2 [Centropristis striata]
MSLADQQWCPTSVQVTVHQARGLRIKGKSGTNDAFAIMQVGKEKFQTSVVEKCVAPVWKEEAAFDLPPLLLHQGGGGGGTERSTLHVHVLHRALVGPDKLLGQAVINLLLLSEDKTRNKTEWFKLLDKTGKADKDRGEVLVDIQFMRNNMTASMFDLSAAGKSRSRLGKFKDKVRGKKKESDTASNVVPPFSQVLTDSEEEGNGDGEVAVVKDEKKKKHKMKSLFSPKSNLQKNMSQSMSVLPGKNSSLSGSQSSGLNVDSSEGKKKFKFLKHKRSGSSDSKDSSLGQQKHAAAEQSNLCINGSHVYCEEPPPRTSRIGSNYSLASSGLGSMEDVPESSPPSVDSLRAVRQYSPWTEEEEEEVEKMKEDEGELNREETIRMEEEERRRKEEEERVRRQEELERLRQEEEERRRTEEERVKREEEERIRRHEEERAQEERRRQEEEERLRREEKERERLAEEKRRLEEQEMRQREEEEKIKMEEERAQEERRRQEEEERKLAEEKWKLEEDERRIEEERDKKEKEERIRRAVERAEEERRRREKEEMLRRQEEEREEKRRLEEQERRCREEEERIRVEEERALEEKRQEEDERVRREEEERELEEKRRLEEQEKRQKEIEESIRVEEERAQEERRRQEEEYKLAEEKRIEEEKFRKEEEERIRKEEERRRQEEEEKVRMQEEEHKEKRRLEEQERKQREEDERIKKEEEERKAMREKEEFERLVEEKRKLEEEERKSIEAEEKRIRAEEERRMKEEEDERVKRQEEEERRLEEQKKRVEEEEKRQREEEERRREEEERARREKEEHERLVEEKMRQEEEERRRVEEEEKNQREEEERRKREEKAEKKRKEEEARKLEKEKLARKAEEQKKKENLSKHKAAGKKPKESPAEVPSTNPFDENFSNPSDETPDSPAEPLQQRVQSVASLVASKPISADEKDPNSTQREKRPAPRPPGRNQAERQSQREQDESTQHLAQINKKSKEKDIKTVSVLPQRSVQMIAPLSRSPTDAKMQNSATKETSNVAKHNKRHAPPRPRSEEEEPSSEHKKEAKQVPAVYGLNPFDDDEDESAAQNDTTTSGDAGSVQWPPAVSRTADQDSASQTKIKSSKTRAPPLPVKKAGGDRVTDDKCVTDNAASDPKSEAASPVQVQEDPLQVSQPATVQSAAGEAGGKKEGPQIAPRRLQPVKPLNPLEQQFVSGAQEEKENKSTGILCEVQQKTKVNDTGLKGPYSQLTREELISLVLKQENQLSERDTKISQLELYIDNLLVRVMEEQPSILMSLNSLKKAA